MFRTYFKPDNLKIVILDGNEKRFRGLGGMASSADYDITAKKAISHGDVTLILNILTDTKHN